mgnify:CR=1 FL=1
MQVGTGRSILNGIAIGKLKLYKKKNTTISAAEVADTAAEIERFEDARAKAIDQQTALYEKALDEAGEDIAEVFNIHAMMLDDDDFVDAIKEIINGQHMCAEYAVKKAGDNQAAVFAAMDDPYLQARSADVIDIAQAMLDILQGVDNATLQGTEPSILVAEDLAPSETVRMDKSLLLGFITREGSSNSHTAILARSMNIPALIQCKDIQDDWDGKMAVVDGYNACVYVDPTPDLLESLKKRQQEDQKKLALLAELKGKPNTTLDGKTVQEKVDDVTRQASLTIMEYRTTNYRPSISVCDEDGNVKQRPHSLASAVYSLPVGSIIMVKDGEQVLAGDIIARKPRETSKTRDIVGGLPRVAELFEVRKPKDMAVVSEIAGTVSFAGEAKGKRKLIVTPEVGESKEYLVPKGKHITVADGDFVEAGDPLTEGSPELHDILRTKGEKYLAAYLVDEIQEVYRFQGVGIDDKHIEVIVRQMLRKVTVTEPGGTSFLVGEQVDKAEFKAENHKAIAEGRQPATAEPLVLGITQASLTTSSFISAASFQETTKVLTEAALKGKMDYLRGLKENVIVGRLIPAGTGYREYVDQDITVPDQKERPDRFLDELSGNPIIADLD